MATQRRILTRLFATTKPSPLSISAKSFSAQASNDSVKDITFQLCQTITRQSKAWELPHIKVDPAVNQIRRSSTMKQLLKTLRNRDTETILRDNTFFGSFYRKKRRGQADSLRRVTATLAESDNSTMSKPRPK